MRVVRITVWLCGLFFYVTTGRLFWSQVTSGGDWKRLVSWLGLFVFLTVIVILGPPMFLLRDRIVAAWAEPGWVFGALGGLLGIVPIVVFFSIQEGINTLFLPEIGLFYLLFGTLGVGFGVVFYLVSGRRPA